MSDLAERLNGFAEQTGPTPVAIGFVEKSDKDAGLAADLTAENLQARVRGLLLMAVSIKLGSLLASI